MHFKAALIFDVVRRTHVWLAGRTIAAYDKTQNDVRDPDGGNGLPDHSPKRKTETIGGQWSPSHATGFEGGVIPVTNL